MWRTGILLLLLSACGLGAPDDATTRYDYRIELPATYVPDPDVHGIDSKVELWRGPGAEISTDFGMYGAPPQCEPDMLDCKVGSERIDGRSALVGRWRYASGPSEKRQPFHRLVHVPIAKRPQALTLNLYARCSSDAACERALALIRTVRIFRSDAEQR